MDELGYVIYAPTLSVAGLRNLASPIELREMLCGRMPSAVSQLTARSPARDQPRSAGIGRDRPRSDALSHPARRAVSIPT